LPDNSGSLVGCDYDLGMKPSVHAVSQYSGTTGNLMGRIALHGFSNNPQGWFAWLAERLPLDGEVLDYLATLTVEPPHARGAVRGTGVRAADYRC
jgi:hypothetical protein